MINLILKDYKFTKKQVIMTLLYWIIVPIALILDNDNKLYFANFFIPFITVSLLVNKICMMEDTIDTRTLLRLLPYSTRKLIGARYLFMILNLIAAQLYLNIIEIFVFKNSTLNEILKTNLFLMIIFLIYFSIYLTLFYSFGYFTANNCIYICMLIFIILTAAYEKLGFKFDISLFYQLKYQLIFLCLGIGIIFIFFNISCIGDKRRKMV